MVCAPLTSYLMILFSINIYCVTDIGDMECSRNGTGCHTNASCVNLDGRQRCVCNMGSVGNGTHCKGNCVIIF